MFANVTSADALRLMRPAAQIVIENAMTALSFTGFTSRRRDGGLTTDKSRRDVAGRTAPAGSFGRELRYIDGMSWTSVTVRCMPWAWYGCMAPFRVLKFSMGVPR